MTQEFQTSPLVKVKELSKSIRDTQNDLTEVKKVLTNTLSFLSSSKKSEIIGLGGMKNCSGIKRFMYDVYGNHCVEFILPWAKQTIFLLIFGSLLIIYAILAWCTVIRNEGEDELDLGNLNVDTLNFSLKGTGKKQQGRIVLVGEKVLSELESKNRLKDQKLIDITDKKNKRHTPLNILDNNLGNIAENLESKLTKKSSELPVNKDSKFSKQKVKFRRPKIEEEDSDDQEIERIDREMKEKERLMKEKRDNQELMKKVAEEARQRKIRKKKTRRDGKNEEEKRTPDRESKENERSSIKEERG